MSDGKKTAKDLLRGFGTSWKADKVGESISFKVKSVDTKAQTDDDGNVKCFEGTKEPMWMIIAEVTDLSDPSGDDRAIWFSGGKFTALRNALSTLPEEQQDIEPGDTATLTMTGQHKPKSAKETGAKIYEVTNYTKGPTQSARALGASTSTNGSSTTAVTSTTGAGYGPKPDYMPDAAWAAMPDDTKASVSPPVDDGRPDNIPPEAWAVMPEGAKVHLRKPTGPTRPEAIPQVAWDMMPPEAQLAAAGAGF